MSTKIQLEYSRSQVAKAGVILTTDGLTDEEYVWAYAVLQNFRAVHAYPINTFQATLRDRLAKIDPNALVAQRLKRTPSIVLKLLRFPKMQLSRMQDIGGLRAVVKDIDTLNKVHSKYKETSKFKHELVGEKNYIQSPKESGYRGIHLVYKYLNPLEPQFDGMLLELQIRTLLQHSWATAVETLGTYLDQSLKSSEGPEEWLNFFSLTASAFAFFEQCPPLNAFSHLSEEETYRRVSSEAHRLNIIDRLKAFSVATNHITEQSKTGAATYHLIVLDPIKKSVGVRSFARRKLDEANQAYAEYEKQILDNNLQVVLVATDSVTSLRQAYPNYFLDTDEFIKKIELIHKYVAGLDSQKKQSNLLTELLGRI